MTNDHSLLSKFKESTLSISLTATLILVASIVVIISSITIQSAYMWLAVGATAVLFLGFCSCTTCEKTSHFQFRRGSVHSDSISTISDGRDNFYEVNHPQSSTPYWIADLPPSYAAATADPVAPESQLPPPYAMVADMQEIVPKCETDTRKPDELTEGCYIGGQSSETVVVIEESPLPVTPENLAGVHINANNRTVRNNATLSDARHQNNCRCENCISSNSASLC